MDIYKLYRAFWDWAFENPEKIKPNHVAVYSFAIEHCNRLGWKKKFGFPTTMVMEATGIKSYNTYKNTIEDLVSFGLIDMIERSKNQYSANIIALSNFDKALNKALDKALTKHSTKQDESTVQSTDSIDIQDTNIQINISFDVFWDLYDKKVGDKSKCEKKWISLTDYEREKIISTLRLFKESIKDKQFQPYPLTYLNQKRWNDDLTPPVKKSSQPTDWLC